MHRIQRTIEKVEQKSKCDTYKYQTNFSDAMKRKRAQVWFSKDLKFSARYLLLTHSSHKMAFYCSVHHSVVYNFNLSFGECLFRFFSLFFYTRSHSVLFAFSHFSYNRKWQIHIYICDWNIWLWFVLCF